MGIAVQGIEGGTGAAGEAAGPIGLGISLIGAFKTVHGRRERRQAAESRARMPEEDFEARGVSDGV